MIGKTSAWYAHLVLGRSPDLKAVGSGLDSCIVHTVSLLVYFYFNGAQRKRVVRGSGVEVVLYGRLGNRMIGRRKNGPQP